ncbi:hypothetical protein GCM10025867_18650 [Frondihabitans sucicola]|uniref:Aminoacyl-tRNA hydrolase n=1 Tax=Frondihabitans sucicola TaxID=1268041 RepID=A0ABN6XXB7_9MICO|nr:hypothetical protein GCM10025867_18650 [Frondihabitans sucicola]
MADDNRWLVVGLGNPGPGYASTRHNVGQMVLTLLGDRLQSGFKNHKTQATVAEGRSFPGGPRLVLAKPLTFMNVSGPPVAALLRYYDLDVSRLIVVHDELDIPFDTLKLKQGAGTAVTTACATSSPPAAPTTSRGSASASAALPVGSRRPTSCCKTSRPRSARRCPTSSTRRQTPSN